MTTEEIVELVTGALEEIKGVDIVCLPVRELTTVTDYMVISTGNSSTHTRALTDEVIRQVKNNGLTIKGVEGREQAEWILVDLGPVVVHVMLAATRSLYNLEDLWNFRPVRAGED